MSPQPSVDSFAHILHMCRLERNQASALHLHACMCSWGLDASPCLGNHLVSMLAEAGSVHVAWNVFVRLVHRTVCSWNSLMAGFIKFGDSRHALALCTRMQEDSLHPNGHTYVALLRACTELKDANRGCKIHAEISKKRWLETNPYVKSTLVYMYAMCGMLVKAQEVFDNLPCQSAVSWNALIAGYAKHGCAKNALDCFDQMQLKGFSPNAITFTCSLKACGIIGAADKGREMHAETARKGLLDSNIIIQTSLVDMYAQCGSLAKAQEVFDKLPSRNIVTWTALIAGYAKHEYGEEALICFERMRLEGVSPNAVSYACSLKACGVIGAIDKGNEIYTEVSQKGLWKSDLLVGNALMDMYIKCGFLARALEVFDELPFRDVISWNAVMTGYAKFELFEETLNSFEQMVREGICPDAITYIFTLKACGSIGAITKARDMHIEVARQGLLERDVVGNAVVEMYVKCGFLGEAREVFDRLPVRDVVSWTVLISGYCGQDCGEEALKQYEQMHLEGVYPNLITFISILKACGSIKDKDKGGLVHAQMAGNGVLQRDPVVRGALIDMYAKCGSISEAKEVFDKSPLQNEILWNTMLAGYTNHKHYEEALQFFDMMTLNGLSPDKITFLFCLKACGFVGATNEGREMHVEIATRGLLERDLAVGNALVDMYAKCGFLAKAQQVLDKLIVQDTVSWTALIAGYVKHDNGKEALKCFEEMQLEGLFPNAVTFNFGLKACASVGALEKGQEMHSEIARQGLLERDYKLSSSLMDMYAKCAQLAKAREVFDKCSSQTVILWNALLSGYAKLDQGEEALICFEEMQHEGVSPDDVTFLNLLSACNRAGLIEEGRMYFNAMSSDHGISPMQEHQRCMTDLFGRAGNLEEARAITKKMASCVNPVLRRSLLSACQKLGNMKLGEDAFEHAVELDEQGAIIHSCFCKFPLDGSVQQNSLKVDSIRLSRQAWKMSMKNSDSFWNETMDLFPVVNKIFSQGNSMYE